MTFWNGRTVLLTGGHGFLGTAIRAELQRRGAANVISPDRRELDLLDQRQVDGFVSAARPGVIIHAAAAVGGIGANREHPGRFFYENAAMGIQLIEAARRAGVGKFVCIGTVCAYPKFTPVPFQEADLWNGYPEETNAPYGLAKKMLLVQLQAYRTEYGMNGVFLIPANLYGPGDDFDPRTSHVIPAMIRKFVEAKERGDSHVVLWGDGTPTREFLFVEDAAEGIVLACESYDDPEPVNLGTSEEISIATLGRLIAGQSGFRGEIRWDPAQPNGQPRRRIDISRAESRFGFRARTRFDDGIARTIEWFLANRHSGNR
jgi:GDP-L-fucose synthase